MPVEEVEEVQSPEDAALEKAFGEIAPLIKDGAITWDDLAQRLRPEPAIVKAPEKLPAVRKVSDKLKLQVKKLPSVFGVVVPDTVRKLEPEEVGKLLEERDVLDDITEDLAKRKEDIRLIVLNNFDAEVREKRCLDTDNDGLMCWAWKDHEGEHVHRFIPLDKDGHFIPEEEGGKWFAHDGKNAERFAWERRAPSKATISPAILEALAKDPECDLITHEEYLAMTERVRVFDEHKAMKAIVKNPKLLLALAEATRSGSVGAALNIRKA